MANLNGRTTNGILVVGNYRKLWNHKESQLQSDNIKGKCFGFIFVCFLK